MKKIDLNFGDESSEKSLTFACYSSPSTSESHDTFRLTEEPATSSPLNSIAEISTFSRGGMNKSRHSLRSSDFDYDKFRSENSYENRDDEGFYSDATISVYFQVRICYFIKVNCLKQGLKIALVCQLANCDKFLSN